MPPGRFFTSLNYSSCNEDWRTEREALRVGEGDRVLCVTGSGDRPLHLLLDSPAEIVAIDSNPAQSALLELKMAAMAELGFEEYRSFLGYGASLTPRLETLETRLAPRLSPAALAFWRANPGLIAAGPLYQGRWERYYRAVARLARLARGGAIDGLFACATIEEQREYVRNRWDRAWWRCVYRVLCSRAFSGIFFKDPAFYRHVDPGMTIGDYVYDRMLACLRRVPARENFMLSLLFRGTLPESDLPPYLTAEGAAATRPRLGRIRVVTEPLLQHLHAAPTGAYTRFSLSDVPSYLDDSAFEALLEAMLRAAAPGARFCIREFLSAHPVPERIRGRLGRERALEEKLEREDRAFAYRFIAGTIPLEGSP